MPIPALSGMFVGLALLGSRDEGTLPPSPFDLELAMELSEEHSAVVGGDLTEVVEYVAEFDGTLHVWTSSELELTLRVEDDGGLPVTNDDDDWEVSASPYTSLDVAEGEGFTISVSGLDGEAGPFVLHLVAAPETRDTLEAAEIALRAASEVELLREEGDHAGARGLLADAVALRYVAGTEYSQEFSDALFEIGFLAYEAGSMDECYQAWKVVYRHVERTLAADDFERIAARANLALAMAERGDIAGARVLEESVLAAYARILPADDRELLSARANLAVSMAEMGDLAGARALEESVLAGYERTLAADDPELLGARENLAVSLEEMGEHAGARALRESVLEVYERTLPSDHLDLLSARTNLARSLHEMGDLEGAREIREEVLAAYERTLPADHADVLHARADLALSLHRTGDVEAARASRESVLAARERTLPADHPDLLSARTELAVSMEATGDTAGVRALLPTLCDGMRARILASLALAPRQARRAVGSEGLRLAVVLSLSESARPELQRRVFELTETMRLVAGEAARSLASFDTDPELAPLLDEAAAVRRTLNDLVAGASRGEGGAEALAAELTRLSLERDRLEREASRLLAKRGVVTSSIEAGALVDALGPKEAFVGYRRLAHWHRDDASGRRELGVEHLLAHVLRADGTLSRVDLGPAAELDELASAWRSAMGAPLLRGLALGDGRDREAEAGVALRERILDPVLSAAGDDVQRLFVCADDLVFLLPLDALPVDEEGAERVGDRVDVVSEVSLARHLREEPAVHGDPSLLAFGGVDYDAPGASPRGLVAASAAIDAREDGEDGDAEGGALRARAAAAEDDVPGTRGTRSAMPARFQRLLMGGLEVEAIGILFEEAFRLEPTLLTREHATKAELFEDAVGQRYVHLATHGWFARESVRSTEDAASAPRSFAHMEIVERVSGLAPMTLCGLALAGANRGRDSLGRVSGILTAEELCSLDLSRCELAVLSACETNVGIRRAGQGIQSLQAALYAAGARTSITSLWKVDDGATRRLMESFYTNLWLGEMGKAEALWAAKRALRDEGHPPSHWAGWVLTGDPD